MTRTRRFRRQQNRPAVTRFSRMRRPLRRPLFRRPRRITGREHPAQRDDRPLHGMSGA